MKENKYDDPSFFDKYSLMPPSVGGLNVAGEWHVLRGIGDNALLSNGFPFSPKYIFHFVPNGIFLYRQKKEGYE
ncbi:hypothetical protein [Chitinophaga sp.]|uniref:hypothetical protein n=1 Tax=Chitinophaga sp. TaxID=1869181 RepID=UPI0039C86B3C